MREIRVDRLQALFEGAAVRGAFHGAVGVYEDGKTLYEAAMGLSDFEKGIPLCIDSLFDLASVTKQFTAAAVLLLHQRGKLNVDDEIRHFFPGIPYPGVTLKMLLNHTGGLPDEDWCVQFLKSTDHPIVNAELVEVLETQPAAPLFQPEEGWAYSNIAYELLASVIEKASEHGFEDFLRSELLLPSGMADSQVYHRYSGLPAPSLLADSRIVENGKVIRPDESVYARYTVPLEGVNGAGLLYTNIRDLMRWDEALRAHAVLGEESLARMYDAVDTGNEEHYGLGIFVEEGGAFLHHGGFWPGFVNEYARWPREGRVLAILTNLTRDQRTMDSLVACARAIVAGQDELKFETTSDRQVMASLGDLERYVGAYGHGAAVIIRNGALCFTWGDGVELPLLPVGEGAFQSPADRNDYLFDKDGLTLRNRRGQRRLPRE